MDSTARRGMKAALHVAKVELTRLDAQRVKIMAAIEFMTEQVEAGTSEPDTSPHQRAAPAKKRMTSADAAAAILSKAGTPLPSGELFGRVSKQLGLTGKHARATFARAVRLDERFVRDHESRWMLKEWASGSLTALPTRSDHEDRGETDDSEDAQMTG
jgi:hypothetical protein